MSAPSRLALVTGAAGFIGSNLCQELLDRGYAVRGVDAFTDYYDVELKRRNVASVGSQLNLVEADLNEADLHDLLAGVSVVFHLAGQPGVRSSWGQDFTHYLEDNIHATQRLLEACKTSPVEKFVFASSSSIYGDAERYPTSESDVPKPISPYGVTKLAAEHLCRLYARTSDIPTVMLRYFTVYGPRQRPDMAFNRFIRATLAGEPIEVYGDGEQRRDFTFVADTVAGTIAAAERGVAGRVYNLAGGEVVSVLDVLDQLAELAGARPQVRHLDGAVGDVRITGGDIALARDDLGYEPQVALADGLAQQFASLRD